MAAGVGRGVGVTAPRRLDRDVVAVHASTQLQPTVAVHAHVCNRPNHQAIYTTVFYSTVKRGKVFPYSRSVGPRADPGTGVFRPGAFGDATGTPPPKMFLALKCHLKRRL